jgi:DNA-binding CsgD family transcriptional regulator
MEGRRFSTGVRRQLLDDQAWYSSAIVSEGRRSSRIDDNLISCFVLDRPGRIHGFQFYRPWGAKPFAMRDRNLLRLLHVELLKSINIDRNESLPPRLGPVLQAVLRGLSSKQVAVELGLSVFTVDGYIKELYRFFGVGSRAQLLAKHLAAPPRRSLALPEGL